MRHVISTRDLLGEFSNRLTEAISLQFRLVRSEISDAASKAGIAAVIVVTGALILFGGLLLLLLAAVALLERFAVAPDLSYLIIGAAAVLVAIGLIYIGWGQFGADTLTLPRSRRQFVELGHFTGTEHL